MNKLVLALASSAAAAAAMADDPGNVNFAEPRWQEASTSTFNDNGGSTFTSSYSEFWSIRPMKLQLISNIRSFRIY